MARILPTLLNCIGEGTGDSPFSSWITAHLGRLLGRRRAKKCIGLEKLATTVDEEKLAIIEFLVFLLQRGDKADEALNKGHCIKGTKPCISLSEAKEFKRLATSIERLVDLIQKHAPLFNMYRRYMLCRTCKLLEVKYSKDTRGS